MYAYTPPPFADHVYQSHIPHPRARARVQIACYPEFGGNVEWQLIEPELNDWKWNVDPASGPPKGQKQEGMDGVDLQETPAPPLESMYTMLTQPHCRMLAEGRKDTRCVGGSLVRVDR